MKSYGRRMLEGYKVLKTIESFAAGTFTAAELADQSGVGLKTVQTVMRRHDSLLEHDSVEKSGGRGRPTVRYRLRADAAESLRERLAAVERAIAPTHEEPPIPTALLAAEEMLCDPSQPPGETELSFAAIGLAAGKRALAERSSEAVAAHVGAVEALLLAAQMTVKSEERSPGRVAAARARSRDAKDTLRRHDPAALDTFVEASERLLAAIS